MASRCRKCESRFEAHRTSKFLTAALGGVPVTTTGVIAVMGARKGFTVKAQPPDGAVIVTLGARWRSGSRNGQWY
jgi:hypothetical protein